MSSQHIAYIRVSSVDQNTDRQLNGLTFDATFTDKASGKDTNRPALTQCLRHVRTGDTLHVHSIDRLARNMSDLLKLVDELTGRGVALEFHKEKLTFTGEVNPFQTLQLQMMGAFAEFERAMIRERQREGIAAAKKRGKQIGAKRKLSPEQVVDIKSKLTAGGTKKVLAQEYGVSRQTLYTALGGA
ncbi:recombinase family protein [Marinobacter psychrophilus]|jgi:DNA invertase Pin-like site-specific DNA recombinase|uniref:recombinase family protein n=1 Tax=Marinobacter psychrophilus TaxID=330734 RepID=UPI001B66539E|nr:recombinase family protein [Marinobacter psychrophilus]MBQ0762970.1 recombinase family protein [Marinobacter psychrophilus]MBQ0846092.1 recombinase family protein [Marinobacter psychrophilus]